jgi:HK97 family phage prohead protease
MKMQKRTVGFELKAVEKDGLFSGYGSVFGTVDAYNEIVAPGAFTESLKAWAAKNKLPKLLWQHISSQPIGVYTKVLEDDKGLYVEGQLLIADVRQAAEAYALMKAGAIDGLSIGYMPTKWEYDEETDQRTLTQIDLWEVSPVTFPACPDAMIDSVKAALGHGRLPSLSEFEKFLCEAGFSNSQAKAIAGKGLSHLHQREAGRPKGEDLAEILAALKTTSV